MGGLFNFKTSAPGHARVRGANLVSAAQEEAPRFERVDWRKEPGLRKLYWHAFVLCIASATTGYDGMFFNSVQNFDSWKSASHSLPRSLACVTLPLFFL